MQVARIILFVYFFAHMYLHFDQVNHPPSCQSKHMFFFSLLKKKQVNVVVLLFMLPGEVGLPAGFLQHTDGAAGALADEPPLVLEDMQGDRENALQSEAERECENGLGCSSNRDRLFFFDNATETGC